MAPRTSTVLRMRWALRVTLRLAAVGMVVYAIYLGYTGMRSYLTQRSPFSGGGWQPNPPWHFVHDATRRVVAAGLLLAVDLWLLPWLVPAGRWACPRCGYALEDVSKPKCPECGQRLSDEVIGPPAAEDAA
jgi:hypothetical protein